METVIDNISILVKEMQILSDSQFQYTSKQNQFIHALPHMSIKVA